MNYYNEIKNELINNEITKKVKDYSKNRSDLTTYYNVGKLLSDAGKHYGEGIINEFSLKLINEVGKKYNTTTLKRMRQFYRMIEKGAPLGHQLTWSHYRELLPIKDIDEIKYYISISIEQNLTRDEMKSKIKSDEYKRLPIEFKNKLKFKEKMEIKDLIKNPIVIKNTINKEIISEKILQQIVLDDLDSFLKELGNSFCYVANEYKIKIGNTYNYIDLLLYNIEFNCYVVVELKVTPLKKEHIGQIGVYMNYIGKHLRKVTQDKTI